MVQIAVLESHSIFRHALKLVFENNEKIHIAGDAEYTDALFRILSRTTVDVVLVSINMPDDTSPIEAVRYIRSKYPEVKILALANEGTALIVRAMMKAGISGYIGKRQANRNELETAICDIAAGQQYIGKVDRIQKSRNITW